MNNTPEMPRNVRWRRILKRIFWGTLLAVILFLVTAVTVVYIFEDEVKQYAVAQLNKELATEIKVKDIELSIIKRFPYASLEFVEVQCLEVNADTANRKNLLTAQSLFLEFSIWDIFDKNYTVKRLHLKKGTAHLRFFKDGSDNFHILKTDTAASETPSNFKFALEKLTVDELAFLLDDYKNKHHIDVAISSLGLSGKFSDKKHETTVKAKVFVNESVISGESYITEKWIKTGVSLRVNTEQKEYAFTDATLDVEDLHLKGSGTVVASEKLRYDLTLEGKDLDISSLLSVLPKGFKKFKDEYQSDGNFWVKASLKGQGGKNAEINASFGVAQGEITHAASGIVLTNLTLDGAFTMNKTPESAFLKLHSFSGRLPNSSFSGAFTLQNLNSPEVNASLQAELDLAELHRFLPIEALQSMKGQAQVNLAFKGKAQQKQFTIYDYLASETSGNLVCSGVELWLKDRPFPFYDVHGQLSFVGSDVQVKGLRGMYGKSDFVMDGNLTNLIAFVMTPDAPLDIIAQVQSQFLNLDELLESPQAEGAKHEAKQSYALEISPRLRFDLNIQVEALRFRKFKANNIRGHVGIRNQVFAAHTLTFNAEQGAVSFTGALNATQPQNLQISCDAQITDIQIQQLFQEFENFNQTTLEDKHLRGKLTASVQFSAGFSPQLQIKLPTVRVEANVKISNGELIKYAPLETLSKFIRVEELAHVKFATLENTISIQNELITIPKMQIQSSAINFVLSGTHRFDNYIDYKFNILLKDLLAQKFKSRNTKQASFGDIIEEPADKGVRIFITMKGPADEAKPVYDGKGAKEKMVEDLKMQKQDLRQILSEEFGVFKKDSTLQAPLVPKKENPNVVKPTDEFEFE